jgi:hypothetical protein
MCDVLERVEMCTDFRWVNPREREHLENPIVDERIILKWGFKKCDGGMD